MARDQQRACVRIRGRTPGPRKQQSQSAGRCRPGVSYFDLGAIEIELEAILGCYVDVTTRAKELSGFWAPFEPGIVPIEQWIKGE